MSFLTHLSAFLIYSEFSFYAKFSFSIKNLILLLYLKVVPALLNIINYYYFKFRGIKMSTSFSLSLELVLLMGWLLKNEKETLKKMINKTLRRGLLKEIELIDTFSQEDLLSTDSKISEELHNSVLDFLIFLEDMLIEGLEFNAKNENNNFVPTLQKINNKKLDNKTILLSLKQANNQVDHTKDKNSPKKHEKLKDILFSELLKNWIPKTNEPVN